MTGDNTHAAPSVRLCFTDQLHTTHMRTARSKIASALQSKVITAPGKKSAGVQMCPLARHKTYKASKRELDEKNGKHVMCQVMAAQNWFF